MELYQIKRRVDIALEQLRVNDNYLLKHDVHEQAITHRLAVYLEHTFGKTHDIDCEYNKNIEESSNQKIIYENIGLEMNNESDDLNKLIAYVSLSELVTVRMSTISIN